MGEEPKISMLIADVDGTLLTKKKILTERAQAAVRALHRSGISFAITSARPPLGMAMLVEPLALTTPIAGFNGGVFAKPNMAIIEEHPLAPDAARQAVQRIIEHRMDVWVYSDTEWFVRDLQGPHVAHEQSTVQFSPTAVDDFGPALDRAVKIVGVSDDYGLVARCETDLREALGAKASATRSQSYYVDVTNPLANKGAVVEALSKFLNIPTEEIATIGDMQNDVLMFHKSGFSIAMGNAAPEIKREAQAVTDSCDDDGFAKAIEKYIIKPADAENKRQAG